MAYGVTRPVDSWAFAVPDPQDPVELAVVERDRQLAPHHCRGGEFLIDTRSIDDR